MKRTIYRCPHCHMVIGGHTGEYRLELCNSIPETVRLHEWRGGCNPKKSIVNRLIYEHDELPDLARAQPKETT